jgi:hypothetical protein
MTFKACWAAGQEGRPIHATDLRHPETERLKSQVLGWDAEYVALGDIESERLFNFGILAPAPTVLPLQMFTCFDSRMAGAGSPRIEVSQRPELIGHGKRLWVTSMVLAAVLDAAASPMSPAPPPQTHTHTQSILSLKH